MSTPLELRAPGSKSLSHRAVICAALARGRSCLTGVLESDDTLRTMDVMQRAGADIKRVGDGCYTVDGLGGAPGCNARLLADAQGIVDCNMGESGTSCRILTSILAAGHGVFRVHGHGRLHARPIGELVQCLRGLGSDIVYEGDTGCPPLLIRANGLAASGGAAARISSDESSQYLSGLLLAAPFSPGGLVLELSGAKAVSWPYVSLTLEAMERSGIRVRLEERVAESDGGWRSLAWRGVRRAEPGRHRFCVEPGEYTAVDVQVEGDWSGASYLLAAGAIGPVGVRVRGLARGSLQGDRAILDILSSMGASIKWVSKTGEDVVEVLPGVLRGVDVDMGGCPDLVPTVLAVAAYARGVTRMYNVAHLRIKESDRMAAPAQELRKVGCTVEYDADSISLTPGPDGWRERVSGAFFSTHNDHRLAMSLSLLELPGQSGISARVSLDDPGCVKKSFPNFWDEWAKVRVGCTGGQS